LGAAILYGVAEAGAATMEQPSASESTPSTIVGQSPTPTAAELVAEAERCLDAKDYVKAAALLEEAAMGGNATAMYLLGRTYRRGDGIGHDYVKAREWYQKAVDAGNSDGMVGLGVLYELGQGVTRDYAKAREWYQKAVDLHNALAMKFLGG